MHFLDLLTPWIAFAATLYPLLYLERWIHQHLYGVGWLLTQDKERATILYYLILSPGVFLHEFSQWLTAGALGVQTRKIQVWPKPQANGTLRLDFVQLKKSDRFKSTMIGMVPFLTGIAIVWIISQNVFDVQSLSAALATGDLQTIVTELRRLFTTPDFWLWLYLLFAIGNAMMPTENDRQNWPLLGVIFGAIAAFLLVLGLGEELLIPALQGPIARALGVLVTAFGTILILDVFVVVGLGLLERVLEQATGNKAKYSTARRSSAPPIEPGSEYAMPEGKAPKPLAERQLPIPPAPDAGRQPRIAQQQTKIAEPQPAQSTLSTRTTAPQAEQPARYGQGIGSGAGQAAQPSGTRLSATPAGGETHGATSGDRTDLRERLQARSSQTSSRSTGPQPGQQRGLPSGAPPRQMPPGQTRPGQASPGQTRPGQTRLFGSSPTSGQARTTKEDEEDDLRRSISSPASDIDTEDDDNELIYEPLDDAP